MEWLEFSKRQVLIIKSEKQEKCSEDNVIVNASVFEWQMAITFYRYHLNRMWDHPFSTYSEFYFLPRDTQEVLVFPKMLRTY